MTSPLPLSIGTLHLVGIGGIGMSGIAEVLHAHGYDVRGSDIAENANVRRLRALGIEVALEQRAENVEGASFVVVSSAIKPDNPEVTAARSARIPLVRRAEMLAELMRLKWSIAVAGTHGKTTTTSLVAALLDAGGHDPTVINGGIINAYGTNARVGSGEWMVVEADESDGAFLRLPATIGIITNIDPEHLDFWGDFDALRQGFGRFVENLPFYGFAALCIDDPEVQALIPTVPERRILTYGFSPQADLRGIDLQEGREGTRFAIRLSERLPGGAREIRDLHLPMVGRHNTQNALAALLVALEVGVGEDALRAGLARFTGVGRRFTTVGEVDGIRIIDDYGHHPTEIAAVLQAARSAAGADRVIAVVQPHRYTRLRDLFQAFCTCFNDADDVLVAPVYPAGETPINGCDHVALAAGLQARGHRHAEAIAGEADLAPRITALAGPGDVVICLGAGSITSWAAALPAALEKARAAHKPARGTA